MADSILDILDEYASNPQVGNRWFKVNLHVHARGSDPAQIVQAAIATEIDLLAITDHQTFEYYEAVAAAGATEERKLTVLPGIEITSTEGVHLLAIFPLDYNHTKREGLIGWLEIDNPGDTRSASRKPTFEILEKIEHEGGITVVPHPYSDDIGLLDRARKIGTREEWLDSGYIGLMQIIAEKVKYIAKDSEGNWINRYVLASANAEQISTSTYSLAPINRSDANSPDDISEGCTWLRMAEPSVLGLKQVVCEPHTRISLTEPAENQYPQILGVKIKGGYFNKQQIHFSDGMSCIIGQNYAGKSAIFDFIRFALQHHSNSIILDDSYDRLLNRINGILKPGGKVRLFLYMDDHYYVVEREYNPDYSTAQSMSTQIECYTKSNVFLLDGDTHELIPVEDFAFPVEVYEQGRINKLREDIERQLDMIDEFAEVRELKNSISSSLEHLDQSADILAPLYEEREVLLAEVSPLNDLEDELSAIEESLPGDEYQKWANSKTVVAEINDILSELQAICEYLEDEEGSIIEGYSNLNTLFFNSMPEFDEGKAAEPKLIAEWLDSLKEAFQKMKTVRLDIVGSLNKLYSVSESIQKKWDSAKDAYDEELNEQLLKAGFESPKQITSRAAELRRQINNINKVKQPRLDTVNRLIAEEETKRQKIIDVLESSISKVYKRRNAKGKELSAQLEDQIKITVQPAADLSDYRSVLNEICDQVSRSDHRIMNRESQIESIITRIPPIPLTRALMNGGQVENSDGSYTPLSEYCGITENTVSILNSISEDIHLLNRLQTLIVQDVPKILVRRQGEAVYGDLRAGLSPGEQSAAILTLALMTRSLPLILDQPEDELGYRYVVHLVVPRLLQAKAKRQLLVISHNANVPVLGDADYVIKMENQPTPDNSRRCTVATEGSFESVEVTDALLELEGGLEAFRFRRKRYTLPR